MRSVVTAGQMGFMRGSLAMAAPRKYPLELRERAVRMCRSTGPRSRIRKLGADP